MGWVSFNEDIEKLRDERAHFLRGITAIKKKVQQTRSLKELKRTERDVELLAQRVVKALDSILQEAVAAFDEAERRLSDPNVRITKSLDKKDSQLDRLQKRNSELQEQICACREKRDSLQADKHRLSEENESLRAELARLLDNEVLWSKEIRNIRPRKS